MSGSTGTMILRPSRGRGVRASVASVAVSVALVAVFAVGRWTAPEPSVIRAPGPVVIGSHDVPANVAPHHHGVVKEG
jgi:hypothetical protein